MADDTSRNIALNLKQLREARGLTQAQLAKISGVPRPTWANLESGDANPTVSVLVKVASALQVSIEELIHPPRAACRHYPVEALAVRKRGETSIRRVLPDSLRTLDLERMALPAGARFGGVPHRTGTREYLTCESGQIELSVAGESWMLMPGDVMVFRGDQRHSYRNPSRSTGAVAYSLVLLAPVSE